MKRDDLIQGRALARAGLGANMVAGQYLTFSHWCPEADRARIISVRSGCRIEPLQRTNIPSRAHGGDILAPVGFRIPVDRLTTASLLQGSCEQFGHLATEPRKLQTGRSISTRTHDKAATFEPASRAR
jgi:hypothetical protein